MNFRHERIDDSPPSTQLGFCTTVDLTGNGRQDLIVGGAGESFPGRAPLWRAQKHGIPTFQSVRSLLGLSETSLFWYENPGWERHDVASVPHIDVGVTSHDLTGDGRPNVITGQGINHTDVFWFELPDDPRDRWRPHLITDAFEKYHDFETGDIDGDGKPELIGLSQESETLFYYDIPSDPSQSPWPEDHLHVIDDSEEMEGIAVTDIDNDGQTDLIAGTNVYRFDGSEWYREPIVTGWDNTRVAVADLDGDGTEEIVFSEGDSPHLGTHPGRVAWFDSPNSEPNFLARDLFCPHTLQIADFDGDGRPDIYVAEMHLGKHDDPAHYLFLNRGDGTFEQRTTARGIGTHEAKAVDMTGNGRPDVVGKSYGPDHHVDIWYNVDSEQ